VPGAHKKVHHGTQKTQGKGIVVKHVVPEEEPEHDDVQGDVADIEGQAEVEIPVGKRKKL
jgi:hypothetical protein